MARIFRKEAQKLREFTAFESLIMTLMITLKLLTA